MSLQGANYGIECTTIRQSLQDLREPVCEQYHDHFYKNSQFSQIEPEINFSTSASIVSSGFQSRNNLHKLYRRLKLFSRRDNRNRPAKDRSNRVFPNKTFRIKEDTADEITKTRWHVWSTFTRKIRVNSSLLSASLTPFDYADNSLSYSPPPPAGNSGVNLDQMFHSPDSRVEHKSPTNSAGFTSAHPQF